MGMKYYIAVFGCQVNFSDAERVSAILESQKYKETSNIAEADLILIVMCSVRQSAVDRVFGLVEKIRELKTTNYKLQTILTGCILKKDKKTFSDLFNYVLPISELINLKRANKFFRGESAPSERLSPQKKLYWRAKEKAYLPISNGCNNFCSYCVVPYTRGRLVCRDHKRILDEAKELVKNGFRELWLLGQNVNDYSSPSDKSVGFAELLKMVNNLPENFKIFFMSPNPKNFSDKLITTMKNCQKFSRYINLPVQSGDNEILKKMNRPYTAQQYVVLVKKIRKAIPDINLSTDVIVGFPGETKKQFENTAKLFEKVKFNIAYISKYSPRWGTLASKMKDDVPWAEKKRREKILMDLINKN